MFEAGRGKHEVSENRRVSTEAAQRNVTRALQAGSPPQTLVPWAWRGAGEGPPP